MFIFILKLFFFLHYIFYTIYVGMTYIVTYSVFDFIDFNMHIFYLLDNTDKFTLINKENKIWLFIQINNYIKYTDIVCQG